MVGSREQIQTDLDLLVVVDPEDYVPEDSRFGPLFSEDFPVKLLYLQLHVIQSETRPHVKTKTR